MYLVAPRNYPPIGLCHTALSCACATMPPYGRRGSEMQKSKAPLRTIRCLQDETQNFMIRKRLAETESYADLGHAHVRRCSRYLNSACRPMPEDMNKSEPRSFLTSGAAS